MSDPMTNAEVEDILASIRRLLSEDGRLVARQEGAKPAIPANNRLVLTPALRVTESDEDHADGAGPDEIAFVSKRSAPLIEAEESAPEEDEWAEPAADELGEAEITDARHREEDPVHALADDRDLHAGHESDEAWEPDEALADVESFEEPHAEDAATSADFGISSAAEALDVATETAAADRDDDAPTAISDAGGVLTWPDDDDEIASQYQAWDDDDDDFDEFEDETPDSDGFGAQASAVIDEDDVEAGPDPLIEAEAAALAPEFPGTPLEEIEAATEDDEPEDANAVDAAKVLSELLRGHQLPIDDDGAAPDPTRLSDMEWNDSFADPDEIDEFAVIKAETGKAVAVEPAEDIAKAQEEQGRSTQVTDDPPDLAGAEPEAIAGTADAEEETLSKDTAMRKPDSVPADVSPGLSAKVAALENLIAARSGLLQEKTRARQNSEASAAQDEPAADEPSVEAADAIVRLTPDMAVPQEEVAASTPRVAVDLTDEAVPLTGKETPDTDTVPAADPGLDASDEDMLDEAELLDEAALRELVRDIVLQELQGALGERITRNVRKLVRREIYRALAAQDLD